MQCRTLQLIKKTMALRAAHMWLDSLSKQLSTQVYTCLVYTKSFFDLKLNKKKKNYARYISARYMPVCYLCREQGKSFWNISLSCGVSKSTVRSKDRTGFEIWNYSSSKAMTTQPRCIIISLLRDTSVCMVFYLWYSIYGILFMFYGIAQHNKDYATPAYHITPAQ